MTAMTSSLERPLAPSWVGRCAALDRLHARPRRRRARRRPGRSPCSCLATGELYALDNVDPFSGASVLSRGLVGDADGVPDRRLADVQAALRPAHAGAASTPTPRRRRPRRRTVIDGVVGTCEVGADVTASPSRSQLTSKPQRDRHAEHGHHRARARAAAARRRRAVPLRVLMDACIGCHSCEVACAEQNGLPPGTTWRRVGEIEGGDHPNTRRFHLSMSCNHCLEPACLEGCPTNAYEKLDNGVVAHHADDCIGCQYCTWNCPYSVPAFQPDRRIVTKCDLCQPRLERRA